MAGAAHCLVPAPSELRLPGGQAGLLVRARLVVGVLTFVFRLACDDMLQWAGQCCLDASRKSHMPRAAALVRYVGKLCLRVSLVESF